MPQNQNNTLVKALHKRGVHFVLCRAKDEGAKKAKSAIAARWQSQAAALKSALAHHAAGGLLGFIPGKSGLWILDVDNSQDVIAIRAGLGELAAQSLTIVPSKRGAHVYFKKNGGEVRNRQWALNGLSGDVRGDRGYVIAWDLGRLASALDRVLGVAPTADSLFPKPGKAGAAPVEGNRNNALNELIFRKAQTGQTEFREERATAIASGLSVGEVDATIQSAFESATNRTFPAKDATALEGVFEQSGWKVRYNLRSMRCDFSLDGGVTWGSTNDRAEKKLRRIIAETFSYRSVKEGKKIIRPLRYGRDAWEEHLGAILADNEVDPFKLWLEALPRWDGTKRLHGLLSDTFKAKDGPLTRWASTYLCLGPIQRCFEPGCKLDEIPILIGAQGIGKSSLLSNLLPASEPDWFSDSLSMTDSLQRRVESLQGRVVVELSDLQGFRKADLESMKAFITRCDDGSVRLAFRRNPELALRRCVLVGSSDKSECLPNDSAGNRRYVPVECHEGCDVERFMGGNREQLWAEALAIYRESSGGVRANLPRNLMQLQTDRAETHRRKDQLAEDRVQDIESDGPFTLAQLCNETKTDEKDGRAVSRLADALRQAGWDKNQERLVSGKRAYLWRLSTH